MTRGLLLSTTLHVSILLLFLLSPRPPAFDWDRADAIAVELVPAPVPPPEVPPVELPEPEPEPEVVEPEPEPTPPADVTPPEPAPVKQSKPRKPKPKYVIKRHAPKRTEDEGPSLAERLQERLADREKPPVEEDLLPESALPAANVPSAEVHASDFPYAWYLNAVRRKITDSWDPPGDRMMTGRANRVIIRFRIHRDGRVTNVELDGGSGTPGLDASARRAVDQAQPFAPLPEGYDGELLDVAVRFTVEEGA